MLNEMEGLPSLLTIFFFQAFFINPNERDDNMFGDLLSSRMIQAGLVFFVVVVGGSLLYSWHVHRTTEAELARHNRLVSRFGLGPYPEIPKEWNFIPDYWEFMVDSIEDELLSRITIKMKKEGTRSKYGSVGVSPTGQVIALERGSVLVEYEINENGEKRIYSTLAHPDDLSQGIYTRFSEIPSHLKIVTPDDIAFDPYEYLGLSK